MRGEVDEFHLLVPGELPASPLNARLHWTAKHKSNKRWYERVKVAWLVAGRPTVGGPFRIEVVRWHTGRRLELDNLYASVKAPIDGLRACGAIVDDSPDFMRELQVTQDRVDEPRREALSLSVYRVRVGAMARSHATA